MDLSLISSASTSLTAAVELCRAAVDARDSQIAASKIAQINTQLLEVQQALFRHNMELLTLQQAHFEATEQLRKANEALAERGRYTLVEVSHGHWAYRVNVPPQQGGPDQPGQTQAPHYVCQPCFDKGRKAVLRFEPGWEHPGGYSGNAALHCPVCSNTWRADRA